MGWIGLQSSNCSRVKSCIHFIVYWIPCLIQLQHPATISTHTLFMFIIISGFSDLFKVKPKGKIWRVHLKLKCLPKTANRSAICLEALK